MKKYIVSFIIIIVFLISMNFIVAGDVNETNNLETYCDESNSDSIVLNVEDDSPQENMMSGEENSLSDSNDGLNHVYVSPNGQGTGSQDDPADFKSTLNSISSNSIRCCG